MSVGFQKTSVCRLLTIISPNFTNLFRKTICSQIYLKSTKNLQKIPKTLICEMSLGCRAYALAHKCNAFQAFQIKSGPPVSCVVQKLVTQRFRPLQVMSHNYLSCNLSRNLVPKALVERNSHSGSRLRRADHSAFIV